MLRLFLTVSVTGLSTCSHSLISRSNSWLLQNEQSVSWLLLLVNLLLLLSNDRKPDWSAQVKIIFQFSDWAESSWKHGRMSDSQGRVVEKPAEPVLFSSLFVNVSVTRLLVFCSYSCTCSDCFFALNMLKSKLVFMVVTCSKFHTVHLRQTLSF